MKKYSKPVMSVDEMMLNSMIATSFGLNDGEVNEGLSKGRRGVWGDLWFEDDVEE